MSDKYIIRNCPASSKDFRLNCQGKAYIDKYKCVYGLLECKDCTDCVLKQIVELCGKYHIIDAGYQKVAINYLSSDILKLLDVQEVE